MPEVRIEALQLGNYQPWWGLTNLFTDPITRSTSLKSFYNGSYNRIVDLFSDNQTEVIWRQGSDGGYYPHVELNYIGGTAPAVGPGRIARAGKLAPKVLKGFKSNYKRMIEHMRKLRAYRSNPHAFDNLGYLSRNAGNQAVQRNIINSRINHLQKEIITFRNNMLKLLN